MLSNVREMKNISVFIEGGKKKVLKFKTPFATYGSLLAAKEVTVFWNGTFTVKTGSNAAVEKTLGEGYWDFQQLKDRLEGEGLTLSMNAYNNTCSIVNKVGQTVNLKKLGKLLGFPENQTLAGGSTTASPNPVDVNHGLRWLTVTCDLIDASKNLGLDGDQSTTLAFLPITAGTRLNSNCHVYQRNAYGWRRAKNTVVSQIEFEVHSNITEKVDVNLLLNIALE